MNDCCNNQHTPYCPQCGTDLRANPLAALRHHVWTQAEGLRKHALRSPGHVSAARKWGAWLIALDELLEPTKGER